MWFDNLIGEFFGTMVLIVFGGGVCACNTLTKSKGQNGGWICITIAWGLSLIHISEPTSQAEIS